MLIFLIESGEIFFYNYITKSSMTLDLFNSEEKLHFTVCLLDLSDQGKINKFMFAINSILEDTTDHEDLIALKRKLEFVNNRIAEIKNLEILS